MTSQLTLSADEKTRKTKECYICRETDRKIMVSDYCDQCQCEKFERNPICLKCYVSFK